MGRRASEQVGRAPGFVLGLAVDGRGRVALCVAEGTPSICVWEAGEVRVVEDAFTYPNYPAFGPDGTLYVSDSGHWGRGDGRVWRVAPDGSREELPGQPDFPNGCAVSPDGRWLWICQSYDPTVSRFDLATGELELVTRIDGTVPDGLACTADGSLEVVADDFQGTVLGAPTNVCFVGAALDRVVSANLGRWHLTLLDIGVRGAPLHYPDTWAADR